MTATTITPERTQFSKWMQASRFFVVSGSIIPVLIGSMSALLYHEKIDWFLLPVMILAAVLFHIASNLMSEYYDFNAGVDRKETYGSSRILVDELLEPKKVRNAGFLIMFIGFLLGLILVYFRGLDILWLGLCGVVGGVFYGAKPFQFKYRAFGDIIIFLLFGPLMSLGAYLGISGNINWDVVWITVPIAFLIVGVLHANNTRDIRDDTKANIKTLASVLGLKGAKFEYYFLVVGAYVATILLILFNVIGYWGFLVLLSLPPAIKNIKLMAKAEVEKPELIAMLDVLTAQHHMMFGILFTIALVLSALV